MTARSDRSPMLPVAHVEDAVGLERHDFVEVTGGPHADRRQAAQLPRVLTRLSLRVHVEPDQLELGVLDDGLQRAQADVAGRPLDHPIATSAHAEFSS